jgi:hypothetical protein
MDVDAWESELARINTETDRIADPFERFQERRRRKQELYQQQAEEAKRRAIKQYAAGEEDDADTDEAYAVLADCERKLAQALGVEEEEFEERMRVCGLDLGPVHRKGIIAARRRAVQVRVSAAIPVCVAPRAGPRPRARREQRHVARSTSSSDSGEPHESEGDGDPPSPIRLRALRLLGLTPRQARWCRRCRCFAYAIDDFEREPLDRLGFRDGLCPDCREQLQ